jgi:hypothetical protein
VVLLAVYGSWTRVPYLGSFVPCGLYDWPGVDFFCFSFFSFFPVVLTRSFEVI